MEIAKPKKNVVLFNSVIKKTEYRLPVKLLEEKTERSSEFLKVCSWCKKLEIPHDKSWVEVEEAAIQIELHKLKKLPMMTHSICPVCNEEMI